MKDKMKITLPKGWVIDIEKSSPETGEVFCKKIEQKSKTVILTEEGECLSVGDTVVVVLRGRIEKLERVGGGFKYIPNAKYFSTKEAAKLYIEELRGLRNKLYDSIEFLMHTQMRLNRDSFYDIFGTRAGYIWDKFSSRSHHLLDLYVLLDEINKDALLTFLTNKKYEAENKQNQAPQEA